MPSDTDAAYLAGFIDGEGTLGVYYIKNDHARKSDKRYYSLRLSISNTNQEILANLHAIWGGNLSLNKQNGHGTLSLYSLAWQAQPKVIEVLELIIPYLKLKKEKAILLLEYCKSRQDRSTHKAGYTDREIKIAQLMSVGCTKGRRRYDRALSRG